MVQRIQRRMPEKCLKKPNRPKCLELKKENRRLHEELAEAKKENYNMSNRFFSRFCEKNREISNQARNLVSKADVCVRLAGSRPDYSMNRIFPTRYNAGKEKDCAHSP